MASSWVWHCFLVKLDKVIVIEEYYACSVGKDYRDYYSIIIFCYIHTYVKKVGRNRIVVNIFKGVTVDLSYSICSELYFKDMLFIFDKTSFVAINKECVSTFHVIDKSEMTVLHWREILGTVYTYVGTVLHWNHSSYSTLYIITHHSC